MKKIIYLTVCSVVLFSCSTKINEPVKTITTTTTTNNTSTIEKNNVIKPLQIPELTLKNQDSVYLGTIFKINADVKDENGNISNDIIWKSSDEKIMKIGNDNFLQALSVGKVNITATSSKYPNISKNFELSIIEREIKSITVKSKKDGYIIAKTGEHKKQFNFDTTLESQDSFEAEVEYKDGTKTNNVIWESNDSNFISVQNGILKGINYGSTYINIYTSDNKSQNVVFKSNFFNSLILPKINLCMGSNIISKYYLNDYNSIIGTTSDIKENVTFDGIVFDTSGKPVDDATVTARSAEPSVYWIGEPQKTQFGTYVFRNAPTCAKIEITAKKDGWTTRTRIEMLKSNLVGDPKANIFDFGFGNGKGESDPNNLYSIQDEPEVSSLKINGVSATDSDVSSTINSVPRTPDGLTPNITGVLSDSLKIEMVFSEPVRRDDVENYFRITSQSNFDTQKEAFIIDRIDNNLIFAWAADDSSVTIKTSKPLLANKTGNEAKYLIDFKKTFRDKTDKDSILNRTFRFTPNKINDFTVFSVKNKNI
ncbi:MAG: hypothetical protein AABZ74_06380 [Cyanobacteriota bacterium]